MSSVRCDPDIHDHGGMHDGLTGEVRLGVHVEPSINLIREDGTVAPGDEQRVYGAYKVAVHEAIHAAHQVCGTPQFSRLLGYSPEEVAEYEQFLAARAGVGEGRLAQYLGVADGNRHPRVWVGGAERAGRRRTASLSATR